jgi:hypothetical protein
MIDPNWDVTDLDPITWRNIGDYILPTRYVRAGSPTEHALYILHDKGAVLNIVDNRLGRRTDIALDRITNPQATANLLHASGEWDRVHVVDKDHLRAVAHEAQSDPRPELTLDAYYRFVASQYWDGEGGYVTTPARPDSWNGWTWGGVKAWVDAIPGELSVGLGVVGTERLEIGVIAVVRDGLVRRLTTFEALPIPRDAAAVTAEYHQQIWDAMAERIAEPYAVLICTPEVFEHWLTGPDKRQTIADAIATGDAHYRGPSG